MTIRHDHGTDGGHQPHRDRLRYGDHAALPARREIVCAAQHCGALFALHGAQGALESAAVTGGWHQAPARAVRITATNWARLRGTVAQLLEGPKAGLGIVAVLAPPSDVLLLGPVVADELTHVAAQLGWSTVEDVEPPFAGRWFCSQTDLVTAMARTLRDSRPRDPFADPIGDHPALRGHELRCACGVRLELDHVLLEHRAQHATRARWVVFGGELFCGRACAAKAKAGGLADAPVAPTVPQLPRPDALADGGSPEALALLARNPFSQPREPGSVAAHVNARGDAVIACAGCPERREVARRIADDPDLFAKWLVTNGLHALADGRYAHKTCLRIAEAQGRPLAPLALNGDKAGGGVVTNEEWQARMAREAGARAARHAAQAETNAKYSAEAHPWGWRPPESPTVPPAGQDVAPAAAPGETDPAQEEGPVDPPPPPRSSTRRGR